MGLGSAVMSMIVLAITVILVIYDGSPYSSLTAAELIYQGKWHMVSQGIPMLIMISVIGFMISCYCAVFFGCYSLDLKSNEDFPAMESIILSRFGKIVSEYKFCEIARCEIGVGDDEGHSSLKLDFWVIGKKNIKTIILSNITIEHYLLKSILNYRFPGFSQHVVMVGQNIDKNK